MPTLKVKDEMNKEAQNGDKEQESKIFIPGISNKSEQSKAKPPIIMEMQGSDKYRPNFDVHHLPSEDDDGSSPGSIQYVFQVSEESSAKDIDVDVSGTELKLSSANYEFHEKFKGFSVDESTVRAKFSKKKGTLTLTIQKVA